MKPIAYSIAILCMSSTLALACSTQRTPHFENDSVKVWTSHICPKEELPFHTHQYPRVLISNSDGDLDVVYKDGRKSKIILKKYIPLYVDAKQGIDLHKDLNNGNLPIDVTVIELKSAK
jgi:hypothetical protein